MRFATRACSADTAAACCWSSQKPGCASSCSSSASRVLSRSGSKVTTDPDQLGPDPFELLLKREFLVGHGGGGWYRPRCGGIHVLSAADAEARQPPRVAGLAV